VRKHRLSGVFIVLVAVIATAASARTGAEKSPAHARAGQGSGTVLVGAASRSVLPLVDGSYDYLSEGFPDRLDLYDPGIAVPEWDDGRIAVGNGESDARWVHDDLRTTAIAIDDPRSPNILVFVDSDLYMVFRVDADEVRSRVAKRLPYGQAKKLKVLITSTHNHHGPDTAFDPNHDWYEHMFEQMVDAIVAAVTSRRPAHLYTASGEHWFGMNDGTDPQVFDPSLNVLQAVDKRGSVIATMVQWNNHPEGTLFWEPPAEAIADDCAALGLEGPDCTAEGRYFTSDFPGIMREDLQARYGGEVAFLNGALGVLIGPGGAEVWEVTDEHPLGNQMHAPAGATAPGGGTNYREKNFRRTVLVGEQLAAAVTRLLETPEKITAPRTSYRAQSFYTYMSNLGFRILMVRNPSTGWMSLGHTPIQLYNCPLMGPKDDDNCVADEFASAIDPNIGQEFRVGDHLRTAVEYVRIGPVGMMFLPGEIPSELTIGLPSQFRVTPENWYEEPPGRHAFGDDYVIPGYAHKRMPDQYKWTIGLGSDQFGYFVPISNFRVYCVADAFVGAGTCNALHQAGLIEFPDAVSGETCKRITEDPSQLEAYGPYAPLIAGSCRYGQAFGESAGHYEETNSAGWDLVEDMMNAVGEITGNPDPSDVNPAFPGWWQGQLPSGDLP